MYLVTDYIKSCTLFELLYPKQTKDEIEGNTIKLAARFWAGNIIEAIVHIHNQGVAYRDLKPENILVDSQGYITLIDLGLAKSLPYTEEGVTHDLTYTLCGTFEYLSPEFFFDGHAHNHAVDYWALGCVIHELVVGRTPFHDGGPQDLRKLFVQICKTHYRPYPFPDNFDELAEWEGYADGGENRSGSFFAIYIRSGRISQRGPG